MPNNIGVMAGVFLRDYERAFHAARRAHERAPSPLSLLNTLDIALYRGRAEVVDSLIRRAWDEGHRRTALYGEAMRDFLAGDWAAVESYCDSLLAPIPGDAPLPNDQRYCGTTDIAPGRLRRGLAA